MEALKALILSLRKSPKDIVNISMILIFVWYIYRRDSYDLDKVKHVDRVAEQRIAHCHSVQEDATRVMDRLNTTLTNHEKAFTHLLYKLDTFIEKMEKTHIKMDALMAKIVLLEHHIKQSEQPHADMQKVLKQIIDELELINKKIK